MQENRELEGEKKEKEVKVTKTMWDKFEKDGYFDTGQLVERWIYNTKRTK